jgi:hypothetical protein
MQREEESATAARTSRRRFAKTVAVALCAAPLAPAFVSRAQAPPATREATAPPQPTPTPQQQPPRPSPAAVAYAEVARLRFPEAKFTDAEFERLKRDFEGNVRTAERLRAFKLKNADEPDFVFSA